MTEPSRARRRYAVPFDPEHFARKASDGPALAPDLAFRSILETNHWAAGQPSGGGSDLEQTAAIRRALPDLARRHAIRTVLDLPCGDGGWMTAVDWPPGTQYLGADLLPELVARCRERYAAPRRRYVQLDLTSSALPQADLLICRDCLVHLSFDDIERALRQIHAARCTWLLTTTFPNEPDNEDITTGDWRPLDLTKTPFCFPPPVEVILEQCTEQDGLFADKSLALWRVDDLPG